MDWKKVTVVGMAIASLTFTAVARAQSTSKPRYGSVRPANTNVEGKFAEGVIFLAPDLSEPRVNSEYALSPQPERVAAQTSAQDASAAARITLEPIDPDRPNQKHVYPIDAPSTLAGLDEIPLEEARNARKEFVDGRKEEVKAEMARQSTQRGTSRFGSTQTPTTTLPQEARFQAPIDDDAEMRAAAQEDVADAEFNLALKKAAMQPVGAPREEAVFVSPNDDLPTVELDAIVDEQVDLTVPSDEIAAPDLVIDDPQDLSTDMPALVDEPAVDEPAAEDDLLMPLDNPAAVGPTEAPAALPELTPSEAAPMPTPSAPSAPSAQSAPSPAPIRAVKPQNAPVAQKPAAPKPTQTRQCVAPMTIPKTRSPENQAAPLAPPVPGSGFAPGSFTSSCYGPGAPPSFSLMPGPCRNVTITNGVINDPTPGYCGPMCYAQTPRDCKTPVRPTVACFTNAAEQNAAQNAVCMGPQRPMMQAPPTFDRSNVVEWEMTSPCAPELAPGEYLVDEEGYPCDAYLAPPQIMSGLVANAEWLGWRTSRPNSTYAAYSNASGDVVDERALSPGGSGIRIALGFRLVSGADLTWTSTYFDGGKSRTAQSDPSGSYALTSPRGSNPPLALDSVSATNDITLNVHELELGRWNWRGVSSWRPYVGFRWTNLKETLATQLASGSDLEATAARSKLNAYAAKFGLEWRRPLAGSLQAYAKAGGSFGGGQIKTLVARSTNGAPSSVYEAEKSVIATSVEAGAGLSWTLGGLEAHGGYEFNDWFNASNLGGKTTDFIAHGWVVGLSWNR